MNIDPVVLIIIIANVIVSLKGFNDIHFFDKYKFQVGAIRRGERIRMFTSAFLHVDYLHLLLNMYVLYIFAPVVLVKVGVMKFCIIYLGSLFAGNLLSLNYHKNELYYSAVGASGAVSGVLYAAILLQPDRGLMIFPIPFYMPAYILGLGYLLYSIYGMKKQIGNVGHAAHIGGAIGGYALMLLLFPEILSMSFMTVVLLGIPIALLLLFGHKLK